ncbi:MAG: regulator, partial [Bacteroidota bacterium]
VPGSFLQYIALPDSLLTYGEHTVAMRVSNFHMPELLKGYWNSCYVEEYQASVREDLVLTAKIFILAGVYLMASLYYLFLFLLRHRNLEVLIFSILCLLFFGLIVMEYLKFLWLYPYPFHYVRLGIIYLLTLTIALLVPVFYLKFNSLK